MKNLTLACVALVGLFSNRSWAAEPIRVVEIKGVVTQSDGTRSSELTLGSVVPPGRLIHTSAASYVMIGLGHDVVTLLAANTEGRVSRVNGKDWELNLQTGTTAAAIRNPEHRPDHYRVRTRSAVLGVRGTVFFVQDLGSKPVFVCTCTGTVDFENLDGKTFQTVKATHHDHPFTIGNRDDHGMIATTPAPMGADHSDADVEHLQKLLTKI